MSTTDVTPRSNRNPILRDFRHDRRAPSRPIPGANYWARKLTAKESPSDLWLEGATVAQQVFAARVLYRYAAVFGGVS